MSHVAEAVPRGKFLLQIEMLMLEKIIYKKPSLYYKLAFYFFTFYLCRSLHVKCLSYRQQIGESFVLIHSAMVYFLIEVLNPFIFKVIINRYALLVFWLFQSYFYNSFLAFFLCDWWLYLVVCLYSLYLLCIYDRCLLMVTMKLTYS